MQLNCLVPELYVKDINRSLAFYNRLDFKILYQRESEKFAFLEHNGSQLMLEELSKHSWLTGLTEIPFGRGINFQIRVNDINQLYEISLQNNFQIYKSIHEKWYHVKDYLHGQKQFLVQDPDGYLIRFFQALGNKST
ncbi:MAG: hypothetical protein A3E87_05715 [Gammaproteobacteria bacterium RIFCSPHIGHO2_12_FULL_35_23]|nr:MAG: hypothetical protein A3E87_05715 [Gammaproteobacteria bacterium RIFCSPHIGHO2_12_FULL_35_23]